MYNVTYDSMPNIIGKLYEKVEKLEVLLLKKTEPIEIQKKFLSAKQSAEYLGISLPTLYSKSSRGELPVIKRNGKLYCLQTDLENYLLAGRKSSNSEIEAKANKYFNK